jgi:hypothetical protein
MAIDNRTALGQVIPLRPYLQGGQPPKPVRVPWDTFVEQLSETWEEGQHLSVIAPTGRGGKTYFITRGLLPLWSDYRVLFIDIKDRDKTVVGDRRAEFEPDRRPFFKTTLHRFPNRAQYEFAPSPKWFRLHVKSGLAGQSLRAQQAIVYEALAKCFKQQDWLIVGDELSFLANDLQLMPALRDIWKRGRSNVTMIAATQSPRWVPGEMFDQPSYLFLGRLGAEGNKRLGEIGGTIDYKLVRDTLAGVHKREFLFVDKTADDPDASMLITGL